MLALKLQGAWRPRLPCVAPRQVATGLPNLPLTCFINSLLQAPVFREVCSGFTGVAFCVAFCVVLLVVSCAALCVVLCCVYCVPLCVVRCALCCG